MDDFAEHVKFLNVFHSALPDYPVNGYNSTHAQRKQCFARAPDMYAIRMHEWRHGDAKKYLPDVSDNMGCFDDNAPCRIIEEAMGISYLRLSCWMRLFNSAS